MLVFYHVWFHKDLHNTAKILLDPVHDHYNFPGREFIAWTDPMSDIMHYILKTDSSVMDGVLHAQMQHCQMPHQKLEEGFQSACERLFRTGYEDNKHFLRFISRRITLEEYQAIAAQKLAEDNAESDVEEIY
eukprot:768525-Hanusia_phi.AAC.3